MISFILILIVSLFFHGLVFRSKSIFSGRQGPGLFQPLKDVWRLFRKGAVYSDVSTIIFRIAPSIYFASVLAAILCVPFGEEKGLLSFSGDFVFFAYALALGKFFMIIAAMDTGSSFEGMGASREAHFSMLAEPAFFAVMGSLGLFTGHTSFHEIFSDLHFETSMSYALSALIVFILLMLAMIENSRIPVDDPGTHLELTMVHEVMVLDNSGFDLGLILYATNLKFAMYGALIANLFLNSFPVVIDIILFMVIQSFFAVSIGAIESFMPRFRMGRNPEFIITLISYALLVFMFVLFITGKIN